jgi:peroxin-4
MLLDNPEADSPLNVDAANILRAGDMRGYKSYIKMLIEIAKRNGKNS